MPTSNQLVRKGRKRKGKRKGVKAMRGNPQRRGVVLRVFVIDPRKPNSGKRHCVRVRFVDGYECTALLPGEHVQVQEHSNVLVTPGSAPDLPGVKFRVIPGVLDAQGDPNRRQRRSKHGIKKQQ